MSTPSKNLALMFRILFFLSESRITRILGFHGLPRSPQPLCPSYHLHPSFYLCYPIRVLCPTYGVCVRYILYLGFEDWQDFFTHF